MCCMYACRRHINMCRQASTVYSYSMVTPTIFSPQSWASPKKCLHVRVVGLGLTVLVTWRFMGSYKWRYNSPNRAYNYSYPTYNPTYSYP